MRLNFNVLWVDDQPGHIEAQATRIAREMQQHGFEFVPRKCQSIDEVRASISDGVFNDEIDLILVDWDLGKAYGQYAIAEIRRQVQYKDVVFYSANKTVDELRRLAFEQNLEGIYCVTRTDLVAEVLGVFDSLVKKVLDLDHVRGIVMGATSDIDHMVCECLAAIHQQCDAPGQKALLTYALKRIGERIERLQEISEKLRGATQLRDFIDAQEIFTSSERLKLLSRALKQDASRPHARYRHSVVVYMQEILHKRNVLGHQVLVPEGRPQVTTVTGDKRMSLEETRVLRCLLLELRGEFRSLLRALEGVGRG